MRAMFAVAFSYVSNQITWAEYLLAITGNMQGKQIAQRTGIGQATISRWLSGTYDPKPHQVVVVARAFDVHPLQALIGAGFLTAQEVDVIEVAPRPLQIRDFSSLELAREIVRRIEEGEDESLEMEIELDIQAPERSDRSDVSRRLHAVPTEEEALGLSAVAKTEVREVPEFDEGSNESV